MTKPRSDPHARIPASDIAALLAERAECLCRELLPAGHRKNAEWIEAHRKDGGLGDSLRVHLTGTRAGVWSHFGTTHSGDALDLVAYLACAGNKGRAIRWAKSFLGIGGAERPTLAPRARSDRKKTERSDDGAGRTIAALGIWRASRDPIGMLTGSYLSHRRITIATPASIRDHRGLKHGPTGLNLPAMVGAITGADRKVIAVQRTFLRCDGRGKANVSEPKMTLGAMRDGAVRLGPAGPVLGIAEGIETGLSAMQLFGLPVWAALSAARLDRLWLPSEAVEIHVFADNGAPGHEAAGRAAKVFRAQGRRVVVRFPPERFGDFNDLLSAEAAA